MMLSCKDCGAHNKRKPLLSVAIKFTKDKSEMSIINCETDRFVCVVELCSFWLRCCAVLRSMMMMTGYSLEYKFDFKCKQSQIHAHSLVSLWVWWFSKNRMNDGTNIWKCSSGHHKLETKTRRNLSSSSQQLATHKLYLESERESQSVIAIHEILLVS